MWVPRAEYARALQDAGRAVALDREVTNLRGVVARLLADRRQDRLLELAPDPVPVTLDMDDGLPSVVRDAIEEFSAGDLQVARHLATVARGRLRKFGRAPTAAQLEELAEEISAGADPELV